MLRYHSLFPAPSTPPEEIQVSAEDSRTLQLTWQPPENRSRNGIIQGYHINITELNTYTTFIYVLEATELSLVVDNLHPYYSYSCVIAAETIELGPFSVAVIIELPEDGKYFITLFVLVNHNIMCVCSTNQLSY